MTVCSCDPADTDGRWHQKYCERRPAATACPYCITGGTAASIAAHVNYRHGDEIAARYTEALQGARALRTAAYGLASTYLGGGRRLGPAHPDELAYGIPSDRRAGVAPTIPIRMTLP